MYIIQNVYSGPSPPPISEPSGWFATSLYATILSDMDDQFVAVLKLLTNDCGTYILFGKT